MNTFFKRLWAGAACGAVALLVACGGGGSDASGTQPEAVYQGTVGGFGSIFVNGVRFDDSQASVTIDDTASTSGALKLGMRVEVQGGVADDGATGTAASVSVDVAVRGAVAQLDTANSRFTIRGITVQTDDKTVFEGASNLASLQLGNWVEVHGSVDFTNRTVQATRVEVKGPEDLGHLVVFGKATGVNATSFTLGDLTVNYVDARLIGFDGRVIPEGAVVRVRATEAPVGNVLRATVVKAVKPKRFADGAPAAVEGRVQQFKSVSDFQVSGTAVDASTAIFDNGTVADLSEGKRVIVRGLLKDGKLIAKKLRFFKNEDDGEVRLIGLVSDYTSLASFKVRGVAVDASHAEFINGDAAQLGNGRLVAIRGASEGSMVVATQLAFEEANAAAHVLTGLVSEYVSPLNFKVGGRAARVADDVRFINGTAADLANGTRLWLTGERAASGVFVAHIVIFPPRVVVGPTQAAGVVSDMASNGSFKLNGAQVTTSGSTQFIGGTSANLVAGAWVIVAGRVTDGVLAAETVKFADRSSNDLCKAFKIEGVVYDLSAAGNFKLMGMTVDASAAAFEGGTAADLANGRWVEACGNELPVDGMLKALKIEIKAAR